MDFLLVPGVGVLRMGLMKWCERQSGTAQARQQCLCPEHGPRTSRLPRKPLLSGAKEEGLPGSADSTSDTSLPLHGGLYPLQELADLSVNTWLLPTFLAPAYNPVDIVGAILFTG